jgi:hypothetical protein
MPGMGDLLFPDFVVWAVCEIVGTELAKFK